jgi:FMN-dependent NADH-azoreductase
MKDNFILFATEMMMSQPPTSRKIYYELLHEYIDKKSDDAFAELNVFVNAAIPDFDNQFNQYLESIK